MAEDRAAMLPLPARPFEARRVTEAAADSLSLVRFDTNSYSVPTSYAHRGLTELVTALREADQDRQLQRLRQQLARLDLLILDELGYVPASKSGAELLFDVIATANERTSVVLTTNLGFENWTEVLGNERLTGAALDRLTHRATIVETAGESYRLQDARRRRKHEPKT